MKSIDDLLIPKKKNPEQLIPKSPDSPNNEETSNITKEELERVRKRVGDFDWKKSKPWKILTSKFGEKLTHEELISIAELLSTSQRIKLDRDAKRRKIVLIKWFEEHWKIFEPLISYIILDFEEK